MPTLTETVSTVLLYLSLPLALALAGLALTGLAAFGGAQRNALASSPRRGWRGSYRPSEGSAGPAQSLITARPPLRWRADVVWC